MYSADCLDFLSVSQLALGRKKMNLREEKEGDGFFQSLVLQSYNSPLFVLSSLKPLFTQSYLKSLAVLSPTNCEFSWSKLAPRGIAFKPVPYLVSVVRNGDGVGKSSRLIIC